MAFYTRTDEAGAVIWSSYGEPPTDLAEGEVECTQADYEAGRSQVWATKPAVDAKPSTASAKARNADKPA